MNTFLIIFLVILLCEATFSTCMKYWYVFRPKVGQPWYVPEIHKDTEVTVSLCEQQHENSVALLCMCTKEDYHLKWQLSNKFIMLSSISPFWTD